MSFTSHQSGAEDRARLRLERLAGSGRHGHAFVARRCDPEADSDTVVVKVGADAARREQERRALTRFSHPAIIGLLDSTDSTLVLEHAEAGTAAGITSERLLSPGEAAGVARSVGSALALMHAADWIHGDVTPDNIGVRSDGTVALIDFATASPADGRALPHHSPNHVGADPTATHSIDCRALAVTLTELLGPDADRSLVGRLDQIVATVDSGAVADIGAVVAVFEGVTADRVTVGAGPPPIGRGGTADFGPRPDPPADQPAREQNRKWPLTLAALTIPIAAVALGWAAIGGAGPTADGSDRSPGLVRSADHTLVENNARWDRSTGRLWLDGSTYPVGSSGDQAALADWNCDGLLSLGVYRPSSAEWFEFESWTAGSSAPPRPLALDGSLAVAVDPAGCARPIGTG